MSTRQGHLPSRRLLFDDARLQALAIKGACFNCGQQGHISAKCPAKEKNAVVQEVKIKEETKAYIDLGKEEP